MQDDHDIGNVMVSELRRGSSEADALHLVKITKQELSEKLAKGPAADAKADAF